jgi:hypothetical protein
MLAEEVAPLGAYFGTAAAGTAMRTVWTMARPLTLERAQIGSALVRFRVGTQQARLSQARIAIV